MSISDRYAVYVNQPKRNMALLVCLRMDQTRTDQCEISKPGTKI